MKLYKLDTATKLPLEVAALNFTKPVIFQLPDGVEIFQSNAAKMAGSFGGLANIIESSGVSLHRNNIYSFRASEYDTGEDVSSKSVPSSNIADRDIRAYNKDPLNYYTPFIQEFVDETLLTGLGEKPTVDELKQRFSVITFMGFSYGGIIAGMISNYVEKKMLANGCSQADVDIVTSCMFGVYTGSVMKERHKHRGAPEIHTAYEYDAQRKYFLQKEPLPRSWVRGQMLQDQMHGNRLFITTYEYAPAVISAKLDPETMEWTPKQVIKDHHPHAFLNISRFNPERNMQTFQVNYAAHILGAALRKGAEAAEQAHQNKGLRNGHAIVKQIRGTFLHEGAIALVARRIGKQYEMYADMVRANKNKAPPAK